MTKNTITITPGTNQEVNLEDSDYVANDGCWIACRGFAIRITPYDDGVSVTMYQDGIECDDSLVETYATFDMLDLAEAEKPADPAVEVA